MDSIENRSRFVFGECNLLVVLCSVLYDLSSPGAHM